MTPETMIDELIEAAQSAQFSSSCGCESCMTAQLSRMEFLASCRLHAIKVVSGLLRACEVAKDEINEHFDPTEFAAAVAEGIQETLDILDAAIVKLEGCAQ